mmetsp:Transcript_31148/g.43171  ORF Transcript_31148/g.43171 Transcript_31148/m.43171 type:complete len:141 (+) Transcript_31148:387-809(+)|eukprot:CAMPEP_0196586402 /NCGR_PEP_ID=MMETSP1081-20130531/54122_1 /TAXON_ID=36882 /ORGANISM="Pyramimonas amylifera, Strain CCMP720" /LENGTH=140 /DNA_ID=CAMNT_0041908269 /DNA_START=12 /DNA_END=434 /DNA_ORIENTATION=-
MEAVSGVEWTFPQTLGERVRYGVFEDLHHRGYIMTDGSKFGADYLAYPGDPSLYHAQFCVRLLESEASLSPLAFQAATRTAHAARKHLLLATIPFSTSDGTSSNEMASEVLYFSVTPDILQSSNKQRFEFPLKEFVPREG